MSRRKSIFIKGFQHANPIPNACRIGNLLVSGVINGVAPVTGKVPPTLAEQCAFLFEHMRSIVEAGGGTTVGSEGILKFSDASDFFIEVFGDYGKHVRSV